jgi:short-subunit dehydrogenase
MDANGDAHRRASETPGTVPFGRRFLITGASGALGSTLARQLAAPDTHLILWARNADRLAAVAAACRALGSVVDQRQLELTDIPAVLAALDSDYDAVPIDAALLVAGQGDGVLPGHFVEPPDQVARLVSSNFTAPAALAAALAARMAVRGQGRILLIGSAAAFHALPHAASYAASKAGLARFADALRLAVAPHGVMITLVSPGFIDWAGGGRPVPRALLLPLEEAARRILVAFDAGVGHAIIPRSFALLRLLDRALPACLREPLLRQLRP